MRYFLRNNTVPKKALYRKTQRSLFPSKESILKGSQEKDDETNIGG